MAIYTYCCQQCLQKSEVVQSIKEYSVKPDVPQCKCGQTMERYLTPPMMNIDIAPWASYKSPIDGQVIDSRAKRHEHMAKHGVVMFDEIKPDIERAQRRIVAEQAAERRSDIVDSIHMANAGQIIKPEVADKDVHTYLNA